MTRRTSAPKRRGTSDRARVERERELAAAEALAPLDPAISESSYADDDDFTLPTKGIEDVDTTFKRMLEPAEDGVTYLLAALDATDAIERDERQIVHRDPKPEPRWRRNAAAMAGAMSLDPTPDQPTPPTADDAPRLVRRAIMKLAPPSRNALALSPDKNPVTVYLAGFPSQFSKDTMRASLERLAAIANVFVPIEEIAWHEMTFAYTMALRAKLVAAYKPATSRHTLAALRGVLKVAWKLDLMTRDQMERTVSWPKVKGKSLPAGREISPKEIAALRAFSEAQGGHYGAFLLGLFAVLLGGGVRATETSRLSIDDYDPTLRVLRVLRKGDKEAELPLVDGSEDLERWIELRRELGRAHDIQTRWMFIRVLNDDRIWPNPLTRKGLASLCKNVAHHAGIANFTPHDCRRTYCTRLLDAGLDLATTQRLMDHTSPATTAIYDRRTARADAEARAKVRIWGAST